MIDSPDALKELLPNVSRETIEKLAEFREMILAEDQNLISKNDKNFIWIRHFYDSLRLAKFITSNENNIIDDMNRLKKNMYLKYLSIDSWSTYL